MRRLAEALLRVRATPSRNAKVDALAEAFTRVAEDDGDTALRVAVRVCLGEPFAPSDSRTTGAGWRLVANVLSEITGASESAIFESARRTGDLGDAACDVMTTHGAGGEGISLFAVRELWDALAAATSRGEKAQLLSRAFRRATPGEARFFAKTILGEVRTGALEGVVLAAIAKAFGESLDDVRRAHALVSDAAETASLARAKLLHTARIIPGRPVLPMLATPREASKAKIPWDKMIAEDKLDGIRAQVHVAGGVASIFGRAQKNVTRAFPDVARVFAGGPQALVIDGEILAVTADGQVRPFQSLQPRLNRADPDASVLAEFPAAFVAYDLLLVGDESLLAEPWQARRARLEATTLGVALNPYVHVSSEEDVERAFEAARSRRHEGTMLKRIDAPYAAGSRGAAWLKVKRAAVTLDVVVTAVEEGHGKRAGALSDYTFAVWKDGALVDVGKAYSGLTDLEIATLGQQFLATTIERRGGWRRVEPRVVLEVGADGVQRSTRHASGFALRFPRILRIRDDKRPEESDAIAAVERMLATQVESGHREDALGLFDEASVATTAGNARPRAPRKKRKPSKAGGRLDDRQLALGLGGDEDGDGEGDEKK